ncbi:hypothetical protein KL928_002372 [Ogataea angusta]|uniref:Uncharacterized protein n=1 Tax=Pichia angusta TaxID=870730 RepID=A0AAN6I6A7_PICAN|nr:uncharacterized protein KL928_002372 [Ogataea angusta]KAG7819698.1 hypothetical protein KL928_002372 [Ogataea angusta]
MTVPDGLKIIEPFVKRAGELAGVQPSIAYLCKLYAAELILDNQLHQTSKEIEQYALQLLDEIEQEKAAIKESSSKSFEIINDPASSFKLVWGFATAIFDRSFKEIANHTATKKTVENFKAALDFYQVLNLWPEQLKDKRQQLDKYQKYAKFHATRILKAIKNGEDPNDYVTPEEEREVAGWDDADSQKPESPSLALPNPPSEINSPEKSPKDTPVETSPPALPSAPDSLEDTLNLPAAPAIIKEEPNKLGLPKTPAKVPDLPAPKPEPKPEPKSQPKTPAKPALSKEDIQQMMQTDEIIAQAQKRARFAISALNYEDIETAIKELQLALELLRGK